MQCALGPAPGVREDRSRKDPSGTSSEDWPSSFPAPAAASGSHRPDETPRTLSGQKAVSSRSLLEKGDAKKKLLRVEPARPQAREVCAGSGVSWHLQRPCDHQVPSVGPVPLAYTLSHLPANVSEILTFGNQSTSPRQLHEHKISSKVCL